MGGRWTTLLLSNVIVMCASAASVKFGHDRTVSPSKLFMNRDSFQEHTKTNISWVEFPDSYKSIVALANGDVEMTVAHSVDIARAFSRKLPVKLVWVPEEIWDTERLIVHTKYHVSEGGPVQTPLHLRGLTIGVTFGGTEHYALESYFKEMQLYQMQGCTYEGPPHCHHKPTPASIVNDTQCKLMIPCHYVPQPNAVNLEAWKMGKIQAVYSGWKDLEYYLADGIDLLSSQELSNWGKVTFHGLLVSDAFLARTDIHPGNFTANVILTYAKAHYYYINNTKEFQIDYAGKESVGARIASVTRKPQNLIAEKLKQIKISTMEDQITCNFLGCGPNGRIAIALKDQAKFCTEIRLDRNAPKSLDQKLRPYQLGDMLDDYSTGITPEYINIMLDQGINASYFLPIGAKLHIGYQITANYGRTTSIVIT